MMMFSRSRKIYLICTAIFCIARITAFQPHRLCLSSSTLSHLSNSNNNNNDERPLTATEIILENERRGPNDQIPLKQSKATATANDDASDRYPLNFPSPLLLASSILLAIVSTGSLFQFMDTKELTTAATAVVGVPIALFLFYAAITKAIVETEEDDKEFLASQRK